MKSFFILSISVLTMAGCSTKESPEIVWRNIEESLQTQLITLSNGDTLDLPEGHFMFTKGLDMNSKSNILIRGKGMDKTILSFKNQKEGAQGILIANGKNIVLEDFSVEDAKG